MRPKRIGQRPAERLGVRRMLEHERALEIAAAVQARREAEVPFQKGAGGAEEIEDG